MNYLIALDHWLFLKINTEWVHPILDDVMPVITDLHKNFIFSYIAGPVALLIFILRERLRSVGVIISCLICFALTDSVSHRLIKPFFERARPFDALPSEAILRSNKHAGFSFPSNHAANMFGLAMLLSLYFPPLRYVFFAIAATIAYSRVYVGVHFPVDVVAGAVIGVLAGTLVYRILRRFSKSIASLTGSRSIFPDAP